MFSDSLLRRRAAATSATSAGSTSKRDELGGRHPAHVGDLDGARRAVERAAIDEHVEIELGVGVEDDLVDAPTRAPQPSSSCSSRTERVDGRLAGLDLAAGKFPHERHRLIGAPLRQQDAARVVAAERGDHQLSRSGRSRHFAFLCHFPGHLTLTRLIPAAYGSRPRSQPVKLYTGKIATIAEEMIRTLVADGDIEVG